MRVQATAAESEGAIMDGSEFADDVLAARPAQAEVLEIESDVEKTEHASPDDDQPRYEIAEYTEGHITSPRTPSEVARELGEDLSAVSEDDDPGTPELQRALLASLGLGEAEAESLGGDEESMGDDPFLPLAERPTDGFPESPTEDGPRPPPFLREVFEDLTKMPPAPVNPLKQQDPRGMLARKQQAPRGMLARKWRLHLPMTAVCRNRPDVSRPAHP